MPFLLDTNVVAALMGPRPQRTVLTRFALHQGQCAIGAPTLHELLFGVARMPRGTKADNTQSAIDALREHLPVVEYDERAAEWHARERARLLAKRRTVQILDGQIGAIAATRGFTLVTANTKDFRHYEGLVLADWTR